MVSRFDDSRYPYRHLNWFGNERQGKKMPSVWKVICDTMLKENANFAFFSEILTAKSGFVSYWQQNLRELQRLALGKLLAIGKTTCFWQKFRANTRQKGR